MKLDRFLTSILAGIGVLVVVALVFFFVRQNGQVYTADDTPTGVVHNYMLALSRSDFERAYGYLVQSDPKPTLDQFRQSYLSSRQNIADVSVQLGEAVVNGDSATVLLYLINSSGNPFNSSSRSQQNATLARQGGAWKITEMPYPFWDYSWYQLQVPPGKAPLTPAQPVPVTP
jgi:hypothetical protein